MTYEERKALRAIMTGNESIIQSQEPSVRLIDANALEEKAVSYLLDGDFDEWAVPLDEIRNAPTIEPKWIPCEERLPKTPKGYPRCEIRRTYFLVSLESGCVKTLGFEFDRMEWQITGSPVIAWMPLPQPYKMQSVVSNPDTDNAKYTCETCKHSLWTCLTCYKDEDGTKSNWEGRE